ncbi:MAG: ribosome maturation factor RimM [Desulfarculaceae bacterium]|nr:ribosome maturation factor RimM [Desulfarculaceae bacterium]MCF8073332.1 ribosome maturation factor RimM [Desulfarculaceae bacterium]MCF8103232.1 ribosome maturation factor RimM [Desulfarculaceae bacterium]MCF8116616.1 ribosome maturation factor RimM [Desulfarculaceae bacterium]
MKQPGLILMGRAAGAFGVKGEVKLTSFARDDKIFTRIGVIHAGADPATARPLTITGARSHGGRLLLRLAEVETREQAAALGGAWVYLRREDLDPLGEDEYYWFQLTGAEVSTKGGRRLGKVASVFEAGAHDLLVVTSPGKPDLLIPVTEDMVPVLDPEAGRVVVDPPPGLLEAQGWEEEEPA